MHDAAADAKSAEAPHAATPNIAYKILTADQWARFAHDGAFHGAPVDMADGYIHLSTAEQMPETLAKHFAGQAGLMIAEIDLSLLPGDVRWEKSRGNALFPHYYGGALPMAAVADFWPATDGEKRQFTQR